MKKPQKKYACPVCGKRYFKYCDADLCADLDSKTKQRLIPVEIYKLKKTEIA